MCWFLHWLFCSGVIIGSWKTLCGSWVQKFTYCTLVVDICMYRCLVGEHSIKTLLLHCRVSILEEWRMIKDSFDWLLCLFCFCIY